ncbi:hypothetical protein EN817_21585 [Mesorhizobium sp. M3A.F.Ca.ET.174.01.1.1]|nr:hypothetical protein EJ074_17455 [Mesorhizobium sp. M3A.F.Ca.ET.080.04.2.1]PBB88898.1 hypothetical protein CK216_03265 [Mesorhizobium sp. WSM3876]RWB70669.1 MAG: hypothetical protein EOQ49_17340 [Mesorhizobium sp.]TGS70826.1 hypothetical protein EN844_08145 [Mesorhizobium sp. M3A.F.Ca.ET.201.01.1.1]TGS85723.1 hypothetical protein EN818_19440 [Mesorhizobium sp. M3A.F.Ca.ET.175.01.1.1]TGT23668.1 hypothetical protein EN817_21585 [Mesorhizobium sp. M3A.F.Ca.ET.174.01.1.1]TGT57199.1 hypothetica
MTDQMSRLRPVFAWAALGVLIAAGAAQSAAALKEANPARPSGTQTAQQMFADAPEGVDPIVTGPVSAAFKQRQQAANCDTAVWPNIPSTCYPD